MKDRTWGIPQESHISSVWIEHKITRSGIELLIAWKGGKRQLSTRETSKAELRKRSRSCRSRQQLTWWELRRCWFECSVSQSFSLVCWQQLSKLLRESSKRNILGHWISISELVSGDVVGRVARGLPTDYGFTCDSMPNPGKSTW